MLFYYYLYTIYSYFKLAIISVFIFVCISLFFWHINLHFEILPALHKLENVHLIFLLNFCYQEWSLVVVVKNSDTGSRMAGPTSLLQCYCVLSLLIISPRFLILSVLYICCRLFCEGCCDIRSELTVLTPADVLLELKGLRMSVITLIAEVSSWHC